MLLFISVISHSKKVLQDAANSFMNNLPFLLGEHSMRNITAKRYEIIEDPDDPELFACEDPGDIPG